MIRIGVVNIDVSHPQAFSQYLNKGNRARYVAVYNDGFRGDDEVDSFIAKQGLEKRCRSIEELAEMVDIGFVQSCNWNNHIKQAMPFIKKGKPVFIDKPIVGSLADCIKLEALASDGAVILGSSSVRYAREIIEFKSRSEEERGQTVNIFGTTGVDEFNYGVHIVEAIGNLAGAGAVSCKFAGRGERDGKICETFFVRFADGATAVYNTFQSIWQPFEVVIMTTKATWQFRIDSAKVYPALLDRICDYMETGRNDLAPVKTLTESIRIMLAGRISRAQGGREMSLAEIPADDPGYDGNAFERGYAAKAAKIYL